MDKETMRETAFGIAIVASLMAFGAALNLAGYAGDTGRQPAATAPAPDGTMTPVAPRSTLGTVGRRA